MKDAHWEREVSLPRTFSRVAKSGTEIINIPFVAPFSMSVCRLVVPPSARPCHIYLPVTTDENGLSYIYRERESGSFGSDLPT